MPKPTKLSLSMHPLGLIGMALLGLTVAACGLRGDLVRPAPASGEDTRVADETEASEEAKARAARARLAQQADQAEASAQQQAASK